MSEQKGHSPASAPAPPPHLEEPLWGRQSLAFQKKVADLEKRHEHYQALVDTLGQMVSGLQDHDRLAQLADRIEMVIKHTSKLEDTLKSAKEISTDARDKPERAEVLAKGLDLRLRPLEQASNNAPRSLPAFGPERQPDPLRESDPWQHWQRPEYFQIHGQQGFGSPPIPQPHPQPRPQAPTLGFSQSDDNIQGPLTPIRQEFSSPIGAAIHSEPVGQILDPIPQETFDKDNWKISLKHFDQDIKKFDGEPSNFRMWWNRIKDHIMTSYQPWGRLLELVERQRVPLTFNFLKTYPRVDGADLDLVWL